MHWTLWSRNLIFAFVCLLTWLSCTERSDQEMSILLTCETKNWILQHSRDQKNIDRPTELRKRRHKLLFFATLPLVNRTGHKQDGLWRDISPRSFATLAYRKVMFALTVVNLFTLKLISVTVLSWAHAQKNALVHRTHAHWFEPLWMNVLKFVLTRRRWFNVKYAWMMEKLTPQTVARTS